MLTITCTLLREVFEGGAPDNPRVPEWPPSWMRMFSALVSVAEPGSADDAALRVLEAASPPDISASQGAGTVRHAYVATNAIGRAGGHTTLPGRTNSERGWARVAPRSPVIRYRWSDLELTDEQFRSLSALCRRVPYLGRSTSPASIVADVSAASDETGPSGEWLHPREAVPVDQRFALVNTLRSPYPGALDALRVAHHDKYVHGRTADPWAIGRGVDYGRAEPLDVHVSPRQGPYTDMVMLRLLGPKRDGRDAARVAAYVRRALMSRIDEPPPSIHGHHGGDVVQVAVLGLPFVNAEHADGHLLGVGLALPELSINDVRTIIDALPEVGDTLSVTAGKLGVLELERLSPLDASRHPRSLRPDRWVEPATTWTTATPMVLDRFLKRAHDVRQEIRRAVVNSRLPEPEVLAVSLRPLVQGAPDMRPRDTLRRPEDRAVKPYRHVTLRFPEPVRGPVVVGSMRHYGLGLCVPVPGEESRDDASHQS